MSASIEITRPFARSSLWLSMLRDGMLLLRPRGFAGLFVLALNGYALGRPAQDWRTLASDLLILFVGWAVLLASGANQFNSAFDRDTGPITMLDRPPAPPRGLAAIALVTMIGGALLFAIRSWVAASFGLLLVAASVLYSYGFGLGRIKQIPILDVVWNGLGYGLGAMAMGYLVTRAPLEARFWWVGLGFAISFAATTVVAQIPKVGSDDEAHAFAALLGPRRAWLVCAALHAVGGLVAAAPWLLAMPSQSLLVDGLVVLFLAIALGCATMCVGLAAAPLTDRRQHTNHLTLLLTARLALLVAAWVG